MGNRVDTACKSSLMPQIVFPLSSPSRVFKRHNVYCVETEVRLVRNSVLFASFMLHRCAPLAARSERLGWGFFVFVLPRRPDDSLTCTTSEYWWPQSLSFTPSLFFFFLWPPLFSACSLEHHLKSNLGSITVHSSLSYKKEGPNDWEWRWENRLSMLMGYNFCCFFVQCRYYYKINSERLLFSVHSSRVGNLWLWY